jgi:hypothetical protein
VDRPRRRPRVQAGWRSSTSSARRNRCTRLTARAVLVFNGEIYNFPRAAPRAEGPRRQISN